MLEHRDIKGTVEFDNETKMFFGKLTGVNGLVMYEADNATEFEKNFISAVDEYIQVCEDNEMPIKKEYKGVFNVRTTPEIHEKLIEISQERNTKLNTIVNEAFDVYLLGRQSIIDNQPSTYGIYREVIAEQPQFQGYRLLPTRGTGFIAQAAKHKAHAGKIQVAKDRIGRFVEHRIKYSSEISKHDLTNPDEPKKHKTT